MTKGSLVEMDRMKSNVFHALGFFWGEGYDSHAFIFEQIIKKLVDSGYASRKEILENWKMFIEEEL